MTRFIFPNTISTPTQHPSQYCRILQTEAQQQLSHSHLRAESRQTGAEESLV